MRKAIIILLAVLLLIVGCRAVTQADEEINTGDIKIWRQSYYGSFMTLKVVDSVTGVQYIVVSGGFDSWGNRSIAICPRYDSDGSLYTGK